jgi:hypothetical protein
MAFSTERILLAWVEDLEQGLEELSRSHRKSHQGELLSDLLQSAHGLLALSQAELRTLSGTDVPLLDNQTGTIRSPDDIRQLCARIRRVFRAESGDNTGESTD